MLRLIRQIRFLQYQLAFFFGPSGFSLDTCNHFICISMGWLFFLFVFVIEYCLHVFFRILRKSSNNENREKLATLRESLREIDRQKEFAKYILTERQIGELVESLKAEQEREASIGLIWEKLWLWIAPFGGLVVLLQFPSFSFDFWPNVLYVSHPAIQALFFSWCCFRVARLVVSLIT